MVDDNALQLQPPLGSTLKKKLSETKLVVQSLRTRSLKNRHEKSCQLLMQEYVLNQPTYEHALFFDGKTLYDAMLQEIAKAKKNIFLESYIFNPDAVGKKIAEALIAKAKEFSMKNDGVARSIIVLFDGLGSPSEKSRSAEFNLLVEQMRAANIEVHIFRPLHKIIYEYDAFTLLRHPLITLFGRNHRKLMVVDDAVAFCGGINIAQEYETVSDVHVRLTGEPVQVFVVSFNNSLLLCKQKEYHMMRYRSKQRSEYLAAKKQLMSTNSFSGLRSFKVVNNTPSFLHFGIRDEYLKMIRAAKKSICIMNAYFIPGWKLTGELIRAAKRGASVKIMLPRVTDHSIIDHARKVFYPALLRGGVQIYHFDKPGVKFLHAKSMTVDGQYATIGSANLDYVSVSLDYELNVFFADSAVSSALDQQFTNNISFSTRVTLADVLRELHDEGIVSRTVRFFSYGILGSLLKPVVPGYY